MPTAARICISLSAAAALIVLWIAAFPSPGNADLIETEDGQSLAATFSSAAAPDTPTHTSGPAGITPRAPTEHSAERQSQQVQVPDLRNLPVWVARKRAKNAGFTFTFTAGDRPLHRADYGLMRTRSQSLEPDTFVQPGATIEFQTEERFRFASGY